VGTAHSISKIQWVLVLQESNLYPLPFLYSDWNISVVLNELGLGGLGIQYFKWLGMIRFRWIANGNIQFVPNDLVRWIGITIFNGPE